MLDFDGMVLWTVTRTLFGVSKYLFAYHQEKLAQLCTQHTGCDKTKGNFGRPSSEGSVSLLWLPQASNVHGI